MKYPFLVEKTPGGYCGYYPDLPGCTSAGSTLEELAQNAREAQALWLGHARECGEEIPPATEAVGMILVGEDENQVDILAVGARVSTRKAG
ncbi:MAG: type II toxin-antitoxin system HicB family antitoxin [Deltaproteobacteria bacterium]|nr:type II toxin-antitoxin system HicB family antitoxin [Deltaproteobacteria bacterium]